MPFYRYLSLSSIRNLNEVSFLFFRCLSLCRNRIDTAGRNLPLCRIILQIFDESPFCSLFLRKYIPPLPDESTHLLETPPFSDRQKEEYNPQPSALLQADPAALFLNPLWKDFPLLPNQTLRKGFFFQFLLRLYLDSLPL